MLTTKVSFKSLFNDSLCNFHYTLSVAYFFNMKTRMDAIEGSGISSTILKTQIRSTPEDFAPFQPPFSSPSNSIAHHSLPDPTCNSAQDQ